MLALLSAPVRRWLLMVLLVPVLAIVLSKVGRYLERRNDGQPTKPSRALVSASSFLRRRTRKGGDER